MPKRTFPNCYSDDSIISTVLIIESSAQPTYFAADGPPLFSRTVLIIETVLTIETLECTGCDIQNQSANKNY